MAGPNERDIAVKEIIETDGPEYRNFIIDEAERCNLDALKFLIMKDDDIVPYLKKLKKIFKEADPTGDLKLKAAKIGYEACFDKKQASEYTKRSVRLEDLEASNAKKKI